MDKVKIPSVCELPGGPRKPFCPQLLNKEIGPLAKFS